ncbi:MAG TPA: BadF/BadG/BcrA/BcrD ATPase family protein [Gammaproteobacteria bacterium]|nr:BadF/BadG/BcrA/BcrD ATPase family protein [Gammaproteobacteria bacterium]
MTAVLAIDVGRTGCRAALWRDGEAAPSHTAEGKGTVGLTAPDGAAVAAEAILAVVEPLVKQSDIVALEAVSLGTPGVFAAEPAARELAERLLSSLPTQSVAIASDAVTSHAGALAGAPGVVLAAGTGAVAVAIGDNGQFHRIDGWGPWLGDEGSGAWLGFAGLRAAMRAVDGRGPHTALEQAAEAQFGSPEERVAQLYAVDNPARLAAGFAPAVGQAAAAKDAVALALMQAAATALATTVIAGARALAHDADPIAVAIVGGLTKLGPVLLEPLHAALQDSAVPLDVRPAQGTALDGARGLARPHHHIHESLVIRAAN